MKSSHPERLQSDPANVVHILDDSMNDGFTWCGKSPTDLANTIHTAATCLFCIVRQAKYRGPDS
jgi:hypothetical protein